MVEGQATAADCRLSELPGACRIHPQGSRQAQHALADKPEAPTGQMGAVTHQAHKLRAEHLTLLPAVVMLHTRLWPWLLFMLCTAECTCDPLQVPGASICRPHDKGLSALLHALQAKYPKLETHTYQDVVHATPKLDDPNCGDIFFFDVGGSKHAARASWRCWAVLESMHVTPCAIYLLSTGTLQFGRRNC